MGKQKKKYEDQVSATIILTAYLESKRKKIMFRKILRRSFLTAIIIFLLLASWFAYEYYSSPKTSPQMFSIEIEKGENAKSIARKLQENGILKKTF